MAFCQKGSSRCLGSLNCRSMSKLSQRKSSQVKTIEKPERFWVFRAATLQKWKIPIFNQPWQILGTLFTNRKFGALWVELIVVFFDITTSLKKKDQTSFFPQMLLPNHLGHLELYKSSMSIIRSVRIAYVFLFFDIFFLRFEVFLVWFPVVVVISCFFLTGASSRDVQRCTVLLSSCDFCWGNAPKQLLGVAFQKNSLWC